MSLHTGYETSRRNFFWSFMERHMDGSRLLRSVRNAMTRYSEPNQRLNVIGTVGKFTFNAYWNLFQRQLPPSDDEQEQREQEPEQQQQWEQEPEQQPEQQQPVQLPEENAFVFTIRYVGRRRPTNIVLPPRDNPPDQPDENGQQSSAEEEPDKPADGQ